jgi:site-specific DNA recombinase
MPTYTYSRFSTDRQTEASIIDQQRACRELAERKGWKITAEFTDEGISGAAFGNRPGVLRLFETACAGDVVLVADLSRLARSQDLAPTIERLRFKGVRVIGVLDGFDSDSPQARMQAGLSGIMSDELRASIRMRTHLALETRAKGARATGGRSFGYDSRVSPIEEEATLVREIFERYASGEPMKAHRR